MDTYVLSFGEAATAARNSDRYTLLRRMIASGRGQELFEEFCMDGAKPTEAKIDSTLDKLLLAAIRR
jgi:hypothetical protein